MDKRKVATSSTFAAMQFLFSSVHNVTHFRGRGGGVFWMESIFFSTQRNSFSHRGLFTSPALSLNPDFALCFSVLTELSHVLCLLSPRLFLYLAKSPSSVELQHLCLKWRPSVQKVPRVPTSALLAPRTPVIL